jgi:hypothetical protein
MIREEKKLGERERKAADCTRKREVQGGRITSYTLGL